MYYTSIIIFYKIISWKNISSKILFLSIVPNNMTLFKNNLIDLYKINLSSKVFDNNNLYKVICIFFMLEYSNYVESIGEFIEDFLIVSGILVVYLD
jgi:hypothetical protein